MDAQKFVNHREISSISLRAIVQLLLRGHGAGWAVGHQMHRSWGNRARLQQMSRFFLVSCEHVAVEEEDIFSLGGGCSTVMREGSTGKVW